ncbi:hypothetical protein SOVF_016210 [Spinacia oleracea]|uniref:Phosphatidylinositol N-acetylglucosaminyltransferase subunit H conserved domain-containing protein n=1 Tax=Spinacia oleracea TaxID=3562 RepID=A0A9R0JI37_SPIOL|nr:uncharacterized protein LOC110775245 [Spinacia oleracea]KNA24369.1 hypothetical protein SOVF_016210 [Spinacia oleracea]
MVEKCIRNSRYMYIHEAGNWPSQTVDVHHLVIRRNRRRTIVACFLAIVLLLYAFYLLLGQLDILVSVLPWYMIIGVTFVRLLRGKLVEKESIVIIPAFGVQLETHYISGRAVRRFVPIDKILKPILNECVTPVTCYWSLAFLLHDEDELMLVFKTLQPPLKMLLPIWKALCAATDSSESLESQSDFQG